MHDNQTEDLTTKLENKNEAVYICLKKALTLFIIIYSELNYRLLKFEGWYYIWQHVIYRIETSMESL